MTIDAAQQLVNTRALVESASLPEPLSERLYSGWYKVHHSVAKGLGSLVQASIVGIVLRESAWCAESEDAGGAWTGATHRWGRDGGGVSREVLVTRRGWADDGWVTITTQAFADGVGISGRTARRHLAILREAGLLDSMQVSLTRANSWSINTPALYSLCEHGERGERWCVLSTGGYCGGCLSLFGLDMPIAGNDAALPEDAQAVGLTCSLPSIAGDTGDDSMDHTVWITPQGVALATTESLCHADKMAGSCGQNGRFFLLSKKKEKTQEGISREPLRVKETENLSEGLEPLDLSRQNPRQAPESDCHASANRPAMVHASTGSEGEGVDEVNTWTTFGSRASDDDEPADSGSGDKKQDKRRSPGGGLGRNSSFGASGSKRPKGPVSRYASQSKKDEAVLSDDERRKERILFVEQRKDDESAMRNDYLWAELLEVFPMHPGEASLSCWRKWRDLTSQRKLDIGRDFLVDVTPEGVIESAKRYSVFAKTEEHPGRVSPLLFWLSGDQEPERSWWFLYPDGRASFTQTTGSAEANVILQHAFNCAHRVKMRREAGIIIKSGGYDGLKRLRDGVCNDAYAHQSTVWATEPLSFFYPHLAPPPAPTDQPITERHGADAAAERPQQYSPPPGARRPSPPAGGAARAEKRVTRSIDIKPPPGSTATSAAGDDLPNGVGAA